MLKYIFCAFLIILGGYMAYIQLSKGKRCSQPATATIVGRDTKRVRGYKGRRSTHYTPVVEFEADGETVQATADVDSIFPNKYKDGNELEIRYNPDQPNEIIVKGKSFRSGVLGGAFLILLGIAGLFLSFT